MADARLWLYRFVSIDAATGLPAQCDVYRAVEGAIVYAYAATGVPAATPAVELVCTLDVPGASAGVDAPWHYVVETDVLPEAEAELNAWYDEEHLPALAAVPGVVRARRLLNPTGSPRYHAAYDLASMDAFGSPPWLAVRATPWSSRVRPAFRNTRRTMFQRVSLGFPHGSQGRECRP